MTDPMKSVCNVAIHEADTALVQIENCIAILQFQEKKEEGEQRRSLVDQRESLLDAKIAIKRAIRFVKQAMEVGA